MVTQRVHVYLLSGSKPDVQDEDEAPFNTHASTYVYYSPVFSIV